MQSNSEINEWKIHYQRYKSKAGFATGSAASAVPLYSSSVVVVFVFLVQ